MSGEPIIEGNVRMGKGVEIGPFAVIKGDVELADGVVVSSHAVITGRVRIGEKSYIGSFATVGTPPQDKNYRGDGSAGVVLGKNVVVREYVSINSSTCEDKPTLVEDGVLLLAGSHVAHDCVVRRGVVITNNVMIAGHVEIEEGAVLGGGCAVHQKRVIGSYAMVVGLSGVRKHLLPFSLFFGVENARVYGINRIGMKRNGFSKDEISAVYRFFSALKRYGMKEELVRSLDDFFGELPRVKGIFASFFEKVGSEPFHVFAG